MTELAWTTAQSGATIEGNIDAQTNVQQAQINASHAQLEPAQAGLVFAKQMKALGWGIRRISEELGCSHMTVRRYIAAGGYVPYRGRGRPRTLAGHEAWLEERFLRHGGNADVVRQELEAEKGIRIRLRTLEREVAPLRARLEAEARATVRFETSPGKQLQIDFGERRIVVGGEPVKVDAPPCFLYSISWKAVQPVTRLRMLYAEYALAALGLVPHMIFLVDFIARGLGQGLDAGAQYWVLFGLGAMVGPILSGHLADRAGYGPALRWAYLIQAVAVVLPAFCSGPVCLIVSSVMVGAFTPGIVPLVLGRVHELLPRDPFAQRSGWTAATTSFALSQAVAAYGLSFLFAETGGNHPLLFIIGAGALASALAIDLTAALAREPRREMV